MNAEYIAVVINSTIRSTTPVLFAAIASALCSRVGVFNIALEGQLLIASFTSIAVNYHTQNIFLATMAGIAAGALVGLIVAVLQVKYKAADMVIGTSINLLVGAATSLMMYTMFGVRGNFSDPSLISMSKVSIPIIEDIPFIGTVFGNLTIIDYLSYIIAVLVFFYLFRTVSGFRMLSIGINKEATESLGIKATRTQMLTVVMSGALCGFGGTVLAMGQVTLFTENMTSGRGFIAMAAASMGQNHPLVIIASSLFFGFAQALGVALQNTIASQLTMAVPYIVTIITLAIFSSRIKRDKNFK